MKDTQENGNRNKKGENTCGNILHKRFLVKIYGEL